MLPEKTQAIPSLEPRFPPSLFFLAIFVGLTLWHVVQWPIEALDTDLWYHLSGGRYIFEHHRLPTDSFFSFINPARPWVDYYWGFQAIVYQLFRQGGYHALVWLRAVLFTGTLFGVLLFVLRNYRQGAPCGWRVFLGVCALLVVLPRSMALRPHLFTYLLIAWCVLICEDGKPAHRWWLPVLGIIWCNVHGVTFPILWLICGAYLLESAVAGIRQSGKAAQPQWRELLPLVLCFATPLMTPHGLKLFQVPLTPTGNASQYIKELTTLALEDFLSFDIQFMGADLQTYVNVFLLIGILSFITALFTRRLKISHALLFVGAWVLLARGRRFGNEYVLLTLPLMRSSLIAVRGSFSCFPKAAYLTLLGVSLLLPLRGIVGTFSEKPAFPVSSQKLPRGVCTFLRSVKAQGNLLNHPDSGGYLQWMLYPRYRIFMDMQIPFLFKDKDIRRVREVYSREEALVNFVKEYQPGFVTVPFFQGEIVENLLKLNFVPVFFDDEEVLYVDQEQHRGIAERYILKTIDPFEANGKSPENFVDGDEKERKPKDRVALMRELKQMLDIYPDCGITNHLASWIYSDEGRPDEMYIRGKRLQAIFPEAPGGYRLMADALSDLDEHDAAIAMYALTIEHAGPGSRALLWRKIGQVYSKQGNYKKAYAILKKNTNLYVGSPSARNLFEFGRAALHSGRVNEAKEVFAYARDIKLMARDAKWRKDFNDDLVLLNSFND